MDVGRVTRISRVCGKTEATEMSKQKHIYNETLCRQKETVEIEWFTVWGTVIRHLYKFKWGRGRHFIFIGKKTVHINSHLKTHSYRLEY